MTRDKIVITGGAGLVGQNLVIQLKEKGYRNIVVIDKAAGNANALRELHPDVDVVVADLAEDDGWQSKLENSYALVHAHAQIGGLDAAIFFRNNVTASERVIEAARQYHVPYIVNVSSSAVTSKAVDDYTQSKKAQEALVAASGIAQIVLRPTLMFGWFDRKHLGWLARLMHRTPVFPIPGNGRFLRQPLYVGDFCKIILAAIEHRKIGTFNISGQERIHYVDLMRAVKESTGARTIFVHVPYQLFALMLRLYGWFSNNPTFTEKQLIALSTPDVFEVIDWPGLFGVTATPLNQALNATFRHPRYSRVVLQF